MRLAGGGAHELLDADVARPYDCKERENEQQNSQTDADEAVRPEMRSSEDEPGSADEQHHDRTNKEEHDGS
jgi:hypothetical protein